MGRIHVAVLMGLSGKRRLLTPLHPQSTRAYLKKHHKYAEKAVFFYILCLDTN
ncbi:hypothetical protein CLOSYM_00226 [[Clostridium] symbiosum ATCC 14940]|uniref:Uncharacterized protein n=1 Tax=[Clostridium] symbiosum ATCC 14940 TaxID=411472 RepID=A0ABC9U3K7_CLOSY|nr:hypothetical protein CLOSYM_00226 [[Clostridium] symbiosum ATCC 14940]